MRVRTRNEFLSAWNASGGTMIDRASVWAERVEMALKQIVLTRMLEDEHLYTPPTDIRLFADDLCLPHIGELNNQQLLKMLGGTFVGWRFSYETFSSINESGEREAVDCLLMQRD